MNNDRLKAIMRSSHFFLKSKSIADQDAYRKQKNYITNLTRKTRKTFFESAASPTSSKSQDFWKVCKPFLSNGSSISLAVILVINDNIVSDDAEVAKAFNSHFIDITDDLNLWQWVPDPLCPQLYNPVDQAIAKYEDHPNKAF